MFCASAASSLPPFQPGNANGVAVRGAADEIDAAVAQHFERLVDRVDQLERHIEPFVLEEAELHRRRGGEVGIRDHVGDGDFHRLVPSLNDAFR